MPRLLRRCSLVGGGRTLLHATYELEAAERLDERRAAEAACVEPAGVERHGARLVGIEQPPAVCGDAVPGAPVAVLELNDGDDALLCAAQQGEERCRGELLHVPQRLLAHLPVGLQPLEALRLHPRYAIDARRLLERVGRQRGDLGGGRRVARVVHRRRRGVGDAVVLAALWEGDLWWPDTDRSRCRGEDRQPRGRRGFCGAHVRDVDGLGALAVGGGGLGALLGLADLLCREDLGDISIRKLHARAARDDAVPLVPLRARLLDRLQPHDHARDDRQPPLRIGLGDVEHPLLVARRSLGRREREAHALAPRVGGHLELHRRLPPAEELHGRLVHNRLLGGDLLDACGGGRRAEVVGRR
mmetsp:Transcript_87506/g.263078  ORF Transcript_87506/g.263078 Transcript_87506/m.263078 type:complete len:358 (-) Transcript_87506:882-1955(-)